jgi:hypothetical protein
MKKIPILIFVLLALTACGTDPRDIADADAIRLQAEQDAADRAQIRQQAADTKALEMAEKQAILPEAIQAKNTIIHYSGIFGAFAISTVLMALAAGASWTVIGTGQALVRAAQVKANLIPMDPTTRIFPLLIQYTGKGRFTMTNPNTGSIACLDTRRAEDRQMISTSGAIQLAGAIAREARKSKDPAAVAIIQPPVITGDLHHE